MVSLPTSITSPPASTTLTRAGSIAVGSMDGSSTIVVFDVSSPTSGAEITDFR
jgi:hypothetical protein